MRPTAGEYAPAALRTGNAGRGAAGVAEADGVAPGAGDTLVLTATCDSRSGTIAAVASFLATRGCYIDDLQQFDDPVARRFFVRVTFRSERGGVLDAVSLREQFAAVARAECMEWDLHERRQRMRVLIMVSQLDHCLEDLLYRQRIGELAMDVTAVVSNHPTLQPTAAQYRVPFLHLPITPPTKAEQEARLLDLVEATRTELVVLARYMQILTDATCERLRGRAVNIHHSFLPGFKGARAYQQAYDRGVKVIGATAHYVTADLDEGPIIEQVVERVDHAFTPALLAEAGRDSERRALSTAVRLVTERRVFLSGPRTVVLR